MISFRLNEKWRYCYTHYQKQTKLTCICTGQVFALKLNRKSMYSFFYITTHRRKNHRIKEILKIPGCEHFNQTKTWKTPQKCIFALRTPLPCGLSNFSRTFKIPTSIFGSETFLEKTTCWLGSSFRRKTWTSSAGGFVKKTCLLFRNNG